MGKNGFLFIAGAIVVLFLTLFLNSKWTKEYENNLAEAEKRTVEAAQKAYDEVKEPTKQQILEAAQNEAYKEAYDEAYNKAKEEHLVTNKVAIVVDTLRETAELEVLKVYDVEYVITDKESNDDGITSWLMVPGEGTYTVDLTAAEFIVDKERGYVLVRVPEPELKNPTLIEDKVEPLFYRNNGFDESIKAGEELINEQLSKASMEIKKALGSNPNFYQAAENSADRMIKALVKALNQNVENLVVDVEFMK